MKRVDVYKWSEIASTKRRAGSARKVREVFRMRDISAVIDLERHLLFYGIGHPDTDREVITVCKSLFDIDLSETFFDMPAEFDDLPDYSPEKARIYHSWRDFESQFETGPSLTDDETVEILMKIDLDFTDERGQPLRCTKLLSRAAELAAKGIKGKLPDKGSDHLAKFEKALTQERDDFLAKRRRARI